MLSPLSLKKGAAFRRYTLYLDVFETQLLVNVSEKHDLFRDIFSEWSAWTPIHFILRGKAVLRIRRKLIASSCCLLRYLEDVVVFTDAYS